MARRILVTSAGSGPCNNLMRSLLRADHASICLVGCHSDRFVLKQSPAQRKFLLQPSDSEQGRKFWLLRPGAAGGGGERRDRSGHSG